MGDPLVELARVAHDRAYAPYSGFRVGAALLAQDGRMYPGCNVENASYGLSMCAERVALGAAVADGATSFRRIVVVSDSNPPASPCGSCRQALAEFGFDLVVVGVGPAGQSEWRLADLLPDAFVAELLNRPPTA